MHYRVHEIMLDHDTMSAERWLISMHQETVRTAHLPKTKLSSAESQMSICPVCLQLCCPFSTLHCIPAAIQTQEDLHRMAMGSYFPCCSGHTCSCLPCRAVTCIVPLNTLRAEPAYLCLLLMQHSSVWCQSDSLLPQTQCS